MTARSSAIATTISLAISVAPGCLQRSERPEDPLLAPERGERPEALSLNPERARVRVSGSTVSVSAFGTIQVPSFELDGEGYTFVMVLRCQESYRDFLSARTGGQESAAPSRLRWVWQDAFANPQQCRVASTHFNGTQFHDIGARNGSFFYVVNPCVDAGSNEGAGAECSNVLALSEVLRYEGAPNDRAREIAARLAEAEARYDAILSKMLGLGRAILREEEACRQEARGREREVQIDNTQWDIIAAAIAASAALGARALLSRRSGSSAQLLNYTRLTRSMLDAPSSTKTLVTAGLAAGAFGVAKFARTHSKAEPTSACARAAEQADELTAAAATLEAAVDAVLAASADLDVVFDASIRFEGYGRSDFALEAEPSTP